MKATLSLRKYELWIIQLSIYKYMQGTYRSSSIINTMIMSRQILVEIHMRVIMSVKT